MQHFLWVPLYFSILSVAMGMSVTSLCYMFQNPIIAMFIDNDEVVTYGNVMILALLMIGPFYGIYQLCQLFLQSIGKAGYAIVVSLLDKGIIFIPVLFVMNYFLRIYGITFTSAVTLTGSMLVAIILSIKWGRKLELL